MTKTHPYYYSHIKQLIAILAAIPIVFLLAGHALAFGDIVNKGGDGGDATAISGALAAAKARASARSAAAAMSNSGGNKQVTTYNAEKNYNAPGGLALGGYAFGNVAQDCVVTLGDALGIGGGGAWTGGVGGITGASGLYSQADTAAWYNTICGSDNAAGDLEDAGLSDAALNAHCMNPFKRQALELAGPGSCDGIPVITKVLIPIEELGISSAFAQAPAGETANAQPAVVKTEYVAQAPGCEIYQSCWKN